MGNTSAKRGSAESIKQRKDQQEQATKVINERVDDASKKIVASLVTTESEGGAASTALTIRTPDPEQVRQLLNIANAAKTQLQKGGAQFDKTDLIGIFSYISRMEGKTINIDEISAKTCDELRFSIRSKVYDPATYSG